MNEAIAAEIACLEGLPRTAFLNQSLRVHIGPEEVTVVATHPDDNGVPMDVWHGVVRSVVLHQGMTPAACAEWLADHGGLIVRVMNGLGSRWDGSNHIGTLTEDARQAERELDAASEAIFESGILSGGTLTEMEASEFLADARAGIEVAQSADAAAALAVEGLDDEDLCDLLDGAVVYVDRERAERLAREWWSAARDD